MTRVELPLYPVFLRMQDVPVLVVGGGIVATRRIHKLLDVCAQITVVAPNVTETLQKWAEDGLLNWYSRTFHSEDVTGMKLVFALTNDGVINQQVVSQAKRMGCLTNNGSQGALGDIILPAVARCSPIDVAISTRGTSPGLAKQLRELLETDVQNGTSSFVDMLRELRNNELDTSGCRIPNDFMDL